MTARKRDSAAKPVKAWAIYSDGKLLTERACDEYDGIGEDHITPLVYMRLGDAKKRGEDVRAVLITPLKRGKK